jgi:uncharacterized protein (DUF58 family)
MSVLSTSVVAAIDDLELVARLVVEGARSGAHRSPFHGFAAEFSQHRPYRPGDDLKFLDWKVLARTNRLYSRQFSETTNLSALIVVDTSRSMDFPDGEPFTKFRYAVVLAAALAYLIIDRGDSAGLMTMADGKLVYLPPKGGRSHLRAILATLQRLEPTGDWELDRTIARGADLLRRRGVLLAISDFYDATDATYREFRRAATGGHDVGLLQVLSRQEITFPYSSDMEFEDLESAARHRVDAGDIAIAYRRSVAEFLERCRGRAVRDGHDYALMPTDVTLAKALRSFLLHRAS